MTWFEVPVALLLEDLPFLVVQAVVCQADWRGRLTCFVSCGWSIAPGVALIGRVHALAHLQ